MQKKTDAKTIIIYIISIILLLTTLICFIMLGLDVLYNKIFYEIDNIFYVSEVTPSPSPDVRIMLSPFLIIPFPRT